MGFIDKVKNFFKDTTLDQKQAEVNLLYERDGLTNEVLDKQLAINRKRHELDIPDQNEMTESNPGFVQ